MLNGCSRFIVHHELQESMKEADVELILQRTVEKFPGVTPRIISDNGPQFIARDFKTFIRAVGMSHVRTSPYYPQSNPKIGRYHKTLKSEGIRPLTPLSLADARTVIEDFVVYYNETRLHSAIGYVTPKLRLEGRHEQVFKQRDAKLEVAREVRRRRRAQHPLTTQPGLSI
ncbi:MAG: putative transposase [Myxococcota bacterium]